MKSLKNWDNKTWLASEKYIAHFHKYLKSRVNFNKKTNILDIGCGRANIISFLQNKYKFIKRPVGLDVIKNRSIKKNITFIKKDAIKYLHFTSNKFDLILIKQTIHFFNIKDINKLLNLAKKKLNRKGKIIILFLKTNKNEFPYFNKMKVELNKSLHRDKLLIKIIEKNFQKYKKDNFVFKVSILKKTYLRMIKKRFISCLLNFSKEEIKSGLQEIDLKYAKKIKFSDKLCSIIYQA